MKNIFTFYLKIPFFIAIISLLSMGFMVDISVEIKEPGIQDSQFVIKFGDAKNGDSMTLKELSKVKKIQVFSAKENKEIENITGFEMKTIKVHNAIEVEALSGYSPTAKLSFEMKVLVKAALSGEKLQIEKVTIEENGNIVEVGPISIYLIEE